MLKILSIFLPKKRRRPLLTIGALFVASAIIRLGGGITDALAREEQARPTLAPNRATHASCEPVDERSLLAALQARQKRIEHKEAFIRDKMHALELAEQAITEKLGRLKTAETSLRKMLSIADEAAENDLAQLTATYEKMKPKSAAALFEKMPAAFAAGFLFRMKPEAAAGVLAGMSPESAYELSMILASRHANTPRN